jgi:hypothetical protein
MKRSLSGTALARLTLALVVAGTLALPDLAQAHCCRSLALVRLTPVDPTAQPRLSGKAELIDCFGQLTLVSVRVNGRVPDGTEFIPVLPGREPILGDWFTMTNGSGEGFIQGVSAPLTGRMIEVDDANFTPVLTGTF